MDEIIDTLKGVFTICFLALVIYTKCEKEEKKEIKSMVPVVVPVSSYSEPAEPSEPMGNPSRTTSATYTGGGGYYPTAPIYDNGGMPANSSGTGSYTGSTSNSGNARQPSSRQCPYCNGTGRLTVDDTSIATFGQTPYWKRCDECGRQYLSSTNHYHMQCRHCHGTGRITTD